jgi:hypothetical protein
MAGTAGYAILRQSVDRDAINIVAGHQAGFVHEALNVFKEEAMRDGPLNESKALDMLGLKSKVIGSATLSLRWLQQSTLPVEPHIISTHAGGPSQFGESERPRSHLPPKSNEIRRPTGQARHLVFATSREHENFYI